MEMGKTIDDLFMEGRSFKSRGNTVKVTRPIVKDMTDAVLTQMGQFSKYPVILEGTRYFGFFDPNILDATYFLASSRSPFHRVVRKEAEQHDHDEQKRSPFDKISQRELCERMGIFKNPRYLDIRKLFSDPYAQTTFTFVPENFADFPYDDIISGLGQLSHSYIFHNMIDGFRIRNSKRGGFTISGRSDVVKKADAETRKIGNPRQRLEAFLEKLIEKGFTLDAVGYKNEQELQQEEVVNGILSHQGNVYIKDARTGGGYLVVRVRKEGDDVYIESDSLEFTSLKERRAKRALELQTRYEGLVKLRAPAILLKSINKLRDGYSLENSVGILKDLLYTLTNPIIEEEVQYETLNGQRAEFRFICQRVPKPNPEDETFEVKGYTKVSDKGVSANISLGGHSEKVYDVLKGMYAQRMPDRTEEELSSRVAAAEEEVMQRVKEFAEKMFVYYASDSTICENGIKAPRDFAVDLIPTWNNKDGTIEYYFLEINYGYGYKGLIEIDPLTAADVEVNRVLINML